MNVSEKIGYLQFLANKYGDFKVTYSKLKPSGEIFFMKWRSVLECSESEKGLKFLEMANHREPLKNEIFLDIDCDSTLKSEYYMNVICDFLEQENINKKGELNLYRAYKSGSKGHHIHFYSKKMMTYSKKEKQEIRGKLLKLFSFLDVDPLKDSDHHMIAMENTKHWKTGNQKTIIRYNYDLINDEYVGEVYTDGFSG